MSPLTSSSLCCCLHCSRNYATGALCQATYSKENLNILILNSIYFNNTSIINLLSNVLFIKMFVSKIFIFSKALSTCAFAIGIMLQNEKKNSVDVMTEGTLRHIGNAYAWDSYIMHTSNFVSYGKWKFFSWNWHFSVVRFT